MDSAAHERGRAHASAAVEPDAAAARALRAIVAQDDFIGASSLAGDRRQLVGKMPGAIEGAEGDGNLHSRPSRIMRASVNG